MIDILLIGLLNALCFWKRPVYLLVPVSMVDVIYGFIYAVSKNVTPVYNSTAFWIGLVVVILGICIFCYEFIWLVILKRG